MAACVVVLGLLSRSTAWVVELVGMWPGDSLWAALVYCLAAAVAPHAPRRAVAAVAVAVSFAVEFQQLLRSPWWVAVRATPLGHLLLGSTFHAPDLAAYGVGVLWAALLDRALLSQNTRPD